MRVLLVEDDINIASFIIRGLRSAGYAVDHAPDGEEGLYLVLTQPYDIAIIDIMLPKRDGLSVIEHMRAKAVSSLIAFLLFYTLITSVIRERTDQDLLNQAGKFSTILREQGIGAVVNFAFLEAQEAGVRKVFFRLLYPPGQARTGEDRSDTPHP